MKPEYPLAIWLSLSCPVARTSASLTLPVVQSPAPFLPGDKPEPELPEHLPDEGNLNVDSVSGGRPMTNASAAVLTATSWQLVTSAYPGPAHDFFAKPVQQHMLKVTRVTPRHRPSLPRARRSC